MGWIAQVEVPRSLADHRSTSSCVIDDESCVPIATESVSEPGAVATGSYNSSET